MRKNVTKKNSMSLIQRQNHSLLGHSEETVQIQLYFQSLSVSAYLFLVSDYNWGRKYSLLLSSPDIDQVSPLCTGMEEALLSCSTCIIIFLCLTFIYLPQASCSKGSLLVLSHSLACTFCMKCPNKSFLFSYLCYLFLVIVLKIRFYDL